MLTTKKIISTIILASIFTNLPLWADPSHFLKRGNDLQEFFWPIILFIKKQILINHTFPLWFNTILSGTPLLPDPQSQLFYPPNILFLFMPIEIAFLINFIIHTVFGGIGFYLAAKAGFRFSRVASLCVAIFTITSPKMAGYFEAGHFGLIEAMAWVPYTMLALLKLFQTKEWRWSILLALSMAGLFYTHTVTFLISAIASAYFFMSYSIIHKKNTIRRAISYLFGAIIGFGLTAIALLPQLDWKNLTTRYLLTEKPQIYPIWNSKIEFLKSVFLPWTTTTGIQGLDTEKWIPLGLSVSSLAILGFILANKKIKLFIILPTAFLLLVALGNSSPLYSIFIQMEWYQLMRVPTRVWFIIVLIAHFLAGSSIDKLLGSRHLKPFIYLLIILSVCESLLLYWTFLAKPAGKREGISSDFYSFIENDKSRYRVFCIDRCIPQLLAVKHDLELVEGYTTVQQINYYQHSWGLVGSYWDYYSLPIPPTGVYKFQKLQPDPKTLGKYNVKYVISPHQLTGKGFTLAKKFDDYFLYINEALQPRASAPITEYSPNFIKIDTSNYHESVLLLAEVYSPGWNAYLNGDEKVEIQESPDRLRVVELKPNIQYVEFKYDPESYKYGRIITFTTLTMLATWFLYYLYQHYY
ncbi:MAG: hypothetical protein UV74_C0013G0315 [Candidatus Woesebacteria bacterium GW2011_GWB1_43_14]|uniref:Uncharacterized protein n=1 Tax=Candidatus Woesebacteria bacterium GW2011_GWB1_43_14 TaxID=1618578 RepID=A0A0G1GEA0_9BACT|nr:MAG: hypothetical protein UT21_C0001G0025 [Candidatus Woesebacteria bacterium GW2011_GWA1_39_11b]KKS78390.1 MAG: hypothetical protein UV51_C0001G0106 [Candidatus Woesebacteria bacterium GW2011_GWC1_42_9]KKS97193.1 MAG: hypothetical protein UV74_C0013G0315 [Candidatus Woesebacteria bacterium GW2011_GWB1_43_14]